MRAAVLGCGPAGLMAVHALKQSGVDDISILSKPRKSEMFGAQYLHAPIPGATSSAPVRVRYILHGSAEAYRIKVYGPAYNGAVSPEELVGDHDAWDIRTTYDQLWEMYGGGRVIDVDLQREDIPSLVKQFDLVVSSVPAPLLCDGRHSFHAQQVQALGDAPERGQIIPYMCSKNTVVCSGEKDTSWYRMSNIFGHKTVEWGTNVQVPLKGVATVQKPLWTNCECVPEVIRVGRYGKWTKGVLSHEAYFDTLRILMGEPV